MKSQSDERSERVLPSVLQIMAIETRRSMLPASRAVDPAQWSSGFAYFATTYGPAMGQFVGALIRGSVHGSRARDMSEEIVQAYFADCMEKDWLFPKDGPIESFRAFVKAQLRAYVINYLDYEYAARRDPRNVGRIERGTDAEPSAPDSADHAFDQSIVDIAVHRALGLLRGASAGDAEVIADLLRTDGRGSDDLLARLGRSDARERDVKGRARKKFAALFREELEAIVHNEDELAILLRDLDRLLP